MKVVNNLRRIMFEQHIDSISELQRLMKDAGRPVARRTLDRLYHNDNNRIDYDTIADLCVVLKVDVGDLFSLRELTEEEMAAEKKEKEKSSSDNQ